MSSQTLPLQTFFSKIYDFSLALLVRSLTKTPTMARKAIEINHQVILNELKEYYQQFFSIISPYFLL